MKERFLTADRMLDLEANTVISGTVDVSGNLILMTKGGSVVNAGIVRGADATALLQIIDSSTVDLTLTGAGTPASPWQLSANVAISSSTVKGLVELATDAEAIAGTDTSRAITPANLKAVLAGQLNSSTIRLSTNSDASLSSTGHAFQVGSDTAFNLIIDNNEIMARNNGANSSLQLQADGGDLNLGNTASTIKVNGLLNYPRTGKVLWSGVWFMNETQTVTLSEAVTDQMMGIVLVWSRYSGGAAANDTWSYDFVPKYHVAVNPGAGVGIVFSSSYSNPTTPGTVYTKYVYINDTQIAGNASNDDNQGATRVLRAVLGV